MTDKIYNSSASMLEDRMPELNYRWDTYTYVYIPVTNKLTKERCKINSFSSVRGVSYCCTMYNVHNLKKYVFTSSISNKFILSYLNVTEHKYIQVLKRPAQMG